MWKLLSVYQSLMDREEKVWKREGSPSLQRATQLSGVKRLLSVNRGSTAWNQGGGDAESLTDCLGEHQATVTLVDSVPGGSGKYRLRI